MPELSLDNLYKLSDQPVWAEARKALESCIRTSPSVRGTFFRGEDAYTGPPAIRAFADDVAVAMVCASISRSSLRGFSRSIDQSKADAYWKGALALDSERFITACAYLHGHYLLQHCSADGTTLQHYLSDTGTLWGDQLARKVTHSYFVENELRKFIAGQSNWLGALRLLMTKIVLLTGRTVEVTARNEGRSLGRDHVLQAWAPVYPALSAGIGAPALSGPSRGFDDAVSRSLVNGFAPGIVAASFKDELFLPEVNAAIAVEGHSSSGNISHYVWGEAVESFIGTHASRLGLATGQSPSNRLAERHGPAHGR